MQVIKSYLSHLECAECDCSVDADTRANLCPECNSSLLARYDLSQLGNYLQPSDWKDRSPDLWRYAEILPIRDPMNRITLGEGGTSIYEIPTYADQIGLHHLWIKDEGLNPTGTFKARGAAVGVARALELGEKTLAMPTAGNAGSAWAAYCARAGLELHVVMPDDTPVVNMREVSACGAKLHLVDGLISDAGTIVGAACSEFGWYEVSTLKEPYRVEGKKTMGFEIAEQFDWQLPDVILYPTGGGVGMIGLWKAFDELEQLGWINGHRPKLIAVQAKGCAPVVSSIELGVEGCEAIIDASTVSSGLRVPKPFADRLLLRIIRSTEGNAIAVSDEDTIEMTKLVASTEGVFVAPEAGAMFAALPKLMSDRQISPDDKVVLLSTGNALKYTDLFKTSNLSILDKDGRIRID